MKRQTSPVLYPKPESGLYGKAKLWGQPEPDHWSFANASDQPDRSDQSDSSDRRR